MLKGLTNELPSDSLRATRSRNRHEFISDARTAFQHASVAHCTTPHTTSLLACDSVAHGSGLEAAEELPTSCPVLHHIDFANSIREFAKFELE